MTAAKSKGKKRIVPKYGPVTVAGDDYQVRTNPPISVYADFMSGDIDRIITAARALVADHPFVDDKDEPLDVAQWPLENVTALVEAYGALMNALPPA